MRGARLGRDCVIHPNAVLYPDVVLGDRVEVHAGTVLGGDGFGYRTTGGRHAKIPHSGRLEVGDDVEIGSNCTIDRATFEATRIGEGTKIDNLVMIGHNNQIGRHNLLCGQVGIAGSCKTGDYVIMAGQAGIKDNTSIGSGVIVGAQAGVHRSVPDGQHVLGSPAIPVREQRRIFQMIARLPEMHRQLRELSAQIAMLTDVAAARCRGRLGGRRARLRPHLGPADRRGVRWRDPDDHPPPPIRRADSAGRADRPPGRKRAVPDPVRRGGAQAGPARGLRRASATRRPRSCGASASPSSSHGVARLGGFIRAFRRLGVKRIVMAGKVTKNVIYTPWRVIQLCPDFRTDPLVVRFAIGPTTATTASCSASSPSSSGTG